MLQRIIFYSMGPFLSASRDRQVSDKQHLNKHFSNKSISDIKNVGRERRRSRQTHISTYTLPKQHRSKCPADTRSSARIASVVRNNFHQRGKPSARRSMTLLICLLTEM